MLGEINIKELFVSRNNVSISLLSLLPVKNLGILFAVFNVIIYANSTENY